MVYALWNTESANIIDTFGSEDAALEEVGLTAEEFGREAVLAGALNACDEAGQRVPIAEGEALIRRALEAITT